MVRICQRRHIKLDRYEVGSLTISTERKYERRILRIARGLCHIEPSLHNLEVAMAYKYLLVDKIVFADAEANN